MLTDAWGEVIGLGHLTDAARRIWVPDLTRVGWVTIFRSIIYGPRSHILIQCE